MGRVRERTCGESQEQVRLGMTEPRRREVQEMHPECQLMTPTVGSLVSTGPAEGHWQIPMGRMSRIARAPEPSYTVLKETSLSAGGQIASR